MPEMDGLGMIKAIKKICDQNNVKYPKFVMISAFDCDSDLEYAKTCGVDKFFKKPFKFN